MFEKKFYPLPKSLLDFIIQFIIFFSNNNNSIKRTIFFQDFIIQKFPFTEFYIDYFFESIRNMFEIWKNLISKY